MSYLPNQLAQLIIDYLAQSQLIDYFISQSLNLEPFPTTGELLMTINNIINMFKSINLNIKIDTPYSTGPLRIIKNRDTNQLTYSTNLALIDNRTLIALLTYFLDSELLTEDEIDEFN